jgi:hypothetical protein
MPMVQPDQGAGLAIAGFYCGLGSVVAPILAIILAVVHVPALPTLLFLAAIPAAIVGVILSAMGRKSTSRGGLAIAGLILSIVALVLFLLFIVLVIVALFVYAQDMQ